MSRSPAVNVQTFINEHPFSGFQWLIFTMCFVIVLLDGFDTAAIGFIAPSLITEWNISKPELAPVLSAALFGLAFGALMVFKLGIEAQKHWRRLNGSALLPKVVTGVQFIDGEELKEQAA